MELTAAVPLRFTPDPLDLAPEGVRIEPRSQEPITYRPSRAVSVFAASVWIVAALSLAWVGAVLGPDSRSGMDGFARLLFTVVPIRPFSWIMAVVFVVLGVRVWRRGSRDAASLIISSDGLTLPTGDPVPWSAIHSAALDDHGRLVIQLAAPGGLRSEGFLGGRTRSVRQRRERESITLSSFDLGTDPSAVANDLSRRLEELRAPGGKV